MKKSISLTQHLTHWRRIAQSIASPKTLGDSWRDRQRILQVSVSKTDVGVGLYEQANQRRCPPKQTASRKNIGSINLSIGSLLFKQLSGSLLAPNSSTSQILRRKCQTAVPSRQSKRHRTPIVLVVAVMSLTSSMGHHFYNQPKLDVGTIAPNTILAPFDAKVEDSKATESKRKEARQGLVPVLTIDSEANQEIYQKLQQTIDRIDEVRQQIGAFPYIKTSILSISTQLYLRRCPEWEWLTVVAATDTKISGQETDKLTDREFSPAPPLPRSSAPISPLSLSPLQQQAVAELQAYQRSTSPPALSKLLNNIASVRSRYAQALAGFSHQSDSPIAPLVDTWVLELSDADWQASQTVMRQAVERILTQGIPPGLPASILEEAVKMHLKTQIPETATPLAGKILLSVLQPNLKKDAEQTRLQAELAVREVKPEMVEITKGEPIVREGEIITQENFLLLDYFGLSRRGINWLGSFGFAGLVLGAVSVFWVVERRFHPGLRRRDHFLIVLLTLSTPVLVSLGVSYTSLPAIGLLIGSFYGSALGVTAVGLLTLGLPIGLEISWEHLLAGVAGGMLASLIAGRLRSREEIAFLGLAIGVTEGFVYLILNLIFSASAGALWYAILGDAALYGLTGLAWSVVALGLSPYLEHLFDLVTTVRLAELANPNRPLLKRLAEEAPGTFQHTLFVATLAEAAAKTLGCNVELVRTGTLYHDIGKLHDPQGFIENQMGGPNKHDEINDPWQSAEIIKKHVTEGIAMARRHRLPKAIEAFIPEHQGTILIAYFYHKAQQESPQPFPEADFRYNGPVPQSRETGIVMLADACEAALRSLKDVSYEEALTTVNKILKSRWQDNQLIDSGLTRAEMPQIAEIFVQVWQQFHHKRIAYPKFKSGKS